MSNCVKFVCQNRLWICLKNTKNTQILHYRHLCRTDMEVNFHYVLLVLSLCVCVESRHLGIQVSLYSNFWCVLKIYTVVVAVTGYRNHLWKTGIKYTQAHFSFTRAVYEQGWRLFALKFVLPTCTKTSTLFLHKPKYNCFMGKKPFHK